MKRKNDENQENAPRNGGVKEISHDLKLRALKLFSSGCGYRKVSSELGIKLYSAGGRSRKDITKTGRSAFRQEWQRMF